MDGEYAKIALCILVGMCVGGAIRHLVLWLSRPREFTYLAFTLLGAIATVYAATSLIVYSSATLETYQTATVVSLYAAETFAIFLLLIARVRTPESSRVFFYAVLLLHVGVIGYMTWLGPWQFLYEESFGLMSRTLPWGESITRVDAITSPAVDSLFLAFCGLYAFLIHVAYKSYRRGARVEALSFFLFALVMAATTINDALVATRSINFIFLSEYSYAILVLVSSFHLSDVVRSAHSTRLALTESERRFHSLDDEFPGVLYVCRNDSVSSISYVTPSIENLTGLSASDFLNREASLEDFHHPDDKALIVRTIQDAVANRTAYQLRYRLRLRDGATKWVRDVGAGVYRDGKLTAIEGVIIDITEWVAAEEDLKQKDALLAKAQRMEAVGQLAGGIAHDFNNTLMVILGYCELGLNRDDLPLELQRDLSEIRAAGDRAAQLVRQLLTFSRNDPMTSEPTDINELLEGARGMLSRVIREDIDVRFDLAPATWRASLDKGQIEQVIMNLCVNARDAMPDGGEIRICTDNVELDPPFCAINPWARPGYFVMLTVQDTGAGMSQDVIEHIFEPFYTTKEVGKGTGLGLATAYSIVRRHNGLIHVYSEVGVGAIFRLYFPITDEDSVPVPVESLDSSDLRGVESVLLAEDDDLVRDQLLNYLKGLGYHVTAAQDGEEALREFERAEPPFDLCILDVVMPKLSGPKAYKRFRPRATSVPVIFSTGYAREELGELAIDDAHTFLIHKPYSPVVLARQMRTIFDAERSLTPSES